jgi:hypothetical protein
MHDPTEQRRQLRSNRPCGLPTLGKRRVTGAARVGANLTRAGAKELCPRLGLLPHSPNPPSNRPVQRPAAKPGKVAHRNGHWPSGCRRRRPTHQPPLSVELARADRSARLVPAGLRKGILAQPRGALSADVLDLDVKGGYMLHYTVQYRPRW